MPRTSLSRDLSRDKAMLCLRKFAGMARWG